MHPGIAAAVTKKKATIPDGLVRKSIAGIAAQGPRLGIV